MSVLVLFFSTTQGTLKKINGRSRTRIKVMDFADLKKSGQKWEICRIGTVFMFRPDLMQTCQRKQELPHTASYSQT